MRFGYARHFVVVVGTGLGSRVLLLAAGLLNGFADDSVDFVQFFFSNGRVLFDDLGDLLDNASVEIFILLFDVIFVAEFIDQQLRQLVTGGLFRVT